MFIIKLPSFQISESWKEWRWASEDFAFQFSTLVLVLPTERVVSFGRMKVFLGRRAAPTVELILVMPSVRYGHYIKVPFCGRFPGHASGRLFCEYCNWVLWLTILCSWKSNWTTCCWSAETQKEQRVWYLKDDNVMLKKHGSTKQERLPYPTQSMWMC